MGGVYRRCDVDAIMTGFRLSRVVMAHGGMPVASRPGGRASSPSRLRSSSIVTPPWVTAATGPGRLRMPAKKFAAGLLPAVRTARSRARGHGRQPCGPTGPRRPPRACCRPSSAVPAAGHRPGPRARSPRRCIRRSPRSGTYRITLATARSCRAQGRAPRCGGGQREARYGEQLKSWRIRASSRLIGAALASVTITCWGTQIGVLPQARATGVHRRSGADEPV